MSNLNNNTHIDLYGGANSSNPLDDDDNFNTVPIDNTPIEGLNNITSPELQEEEEDDDEIQNNDDDSEPELDLNDDDSEPELDLNDDDSEPELDLNDEEEVGEEEEEEEGDEEEEEVGEEEEQDVVEEEVGEEEEQDVVEEEEQSEPDDDFFEEIKNDINEFILDDEDFEIIETEESFAITEEVSIPEYKVIHLDSEQETDVINELINKLPIKDRNNKKHLLEIRNTLEHFINLKKNYSNFNVNNEAISPKFLGDKYKPLVENYYNDKFTNNYLIPIIDTKKIIYKEDPSDERLYFKYNASITEDDINTNTNVLLYNISTINSQFKIINKYRKSSERLNYKYQNELNELLYSINDVYYNNTKGYSSKNIHDTFTISNIFENDISINYSNDVYKNIKYNKQIVMGSDYFNDNLLYPNNINKIGFVKPSDEYLNEIHYLKNTLLEVANSYYSDNIDLNIDNASIEIVNIDYNIGDSVKLCFIDNDTQLELFGTIINIEEDNYIIKPKDYNDVKQYGSLIINKKDKSVVISKNDSIKKEDVDNKRQCFSNTPIIYKFQDGNINSETYKNILDNIIPDNKSFIVNNLDNIKNSKNFKDINNFLSKYSISINDLTSNTFKIISDILTKNNNTIINESNYNKFEDILKNIKNTYTKNPIKLISKKLLKQFEPYYGNYPYYNTSLDTLNVRLSWIHSQIDNGILFYKTIILENYSKIFSSTQATKNGIVKQIQDYNKQLDTFNKKINKEILKYSTKDDCAELIKYRIVKIYTSILDLENDNYKEDITIDDNKKILNDPDNFVKVGQYCILEDNGNNKIYKRELISSKPMWIFQNSMSVDSIIKNNRDFCNLQKLNYDEITSAILANKKSCKYSDITHKCINRDLFDLLGNTEDIIEKIKEKGKMLALLDENENMLEYINVFKKSLEYTLKKYNLFLQNKFKNEKTKYEKYIKPSYDDEYSSLYTKIDIYLSKISLFEPDEYYKNLEILISKYGRDAYSNENKRNVYCKVGNKVIVCKHHTYMIDFYKNPSNSASILEFLKQEYGIIDQGNVFCSNCGQEIYMDEYETIEGFAENGAHIITTEIFDIQDDDTDLFETTNKITAPTQLLNISSFIDESDIYNKDNTTTNKVSHFILKLIGVKLDTNDTKALIDRTNNNNKTTIKTQFNWLKTQKRVPKDKTIIEKAYNNYKTRTEIINTIGNLFIILQTSIPSYKITKTHSKCNPSLSGFPLVDKDEDISGIQYFTCILENLRDSGKLWTSLKKVNIQDTLLNFLERNIQDAFINDLYVEKRIYLQKLLEEKQNIKTKNIWNEFKPPLNKLIIKLDTTNTIDYNDNLKQYNLHKTLLALKTIENIDNTINISNVENKLYNPIPLGNTCCIDTLNDSYNYSNFFNEYTPIEELYKNINVMDNNTPNYDSVNILFKFLNRKNKLESFQDDVFPIKDTDIDIEDIKLLYITFIAEGDHIGKRHVYDENGICLYTGENIEDIKNKKYTIDDFNKFYDNINKSKIFAAYNGNNKNDLISNILKVRDMNPLLKTNKYFNKLIDNIANALKKNVLNLNDIYDDLEAQNTLNINNIVDKIRSDTKMSLSEANNIIQILENIGSLNNILEEDTILYGDIQAKQNFYIKQCELIKSYSKYLHIITYYIKENYTPYNEDIVDTIVKKTNNQLKKSRLQKTHLDTLKNTYNTKREKYLKMKNKLKGDTKSTFSNIYNIIENSLTGIDIINGKPHIYDCKGDIKYFSELTYYNASLILKYLFINTIDIIINNEIASNPLSETTEFGEEDFIDEQLQEDDGIDFIGNIENNNSNKAQFIINLSKYIQENQSYYDKFTNKNINEAIDKKSDIEKEKNLKFIEDLNDESRQSFKVMIKFGLETWKNLSSKNKDLYFERPIQEETVELTENDLDERNRTLAAQELGEDYTEDDYELWNERQSINIREDRLAFEERDILPDIEDDAYDGNAEGYDESLIYN